MIKGCMPRYKGKGIDAKIQRKSYAEGDGKGERGKEANGMLAYMIHHYCEE